MRKSLYLIALAISTFVIIFNSCSDDIISENQEPDRSSDATSQRGHGLSAIQSMERANKFLGKATRSSDTFSVDYVTNPIRTRGAERDTLFYIINYDDENGFMLVPTDDRLEPVYAYSDKGNMLISDTVNNKLLRNYMYGAVADANAALSLDSLELNTKIWDTSDRIKRITPMISEFQGKMHQDKPYNALCPIVHWKDTIWGTGIDTDTLAVAGCGPVAVEILMSYFKHPVLYKGFKYNWNAIDNGYSDVHIAKLLATIGDSEHMKADYGRPQTYTYASSVAPALRKMGYNCKLANFDEKIAEEQLANHPLYVEARNDTLGGHAMVIDGVDVYVSKYWNYQSPVEPPKSRYFHIIWGWGGTNNGYYYIASKYFKNLVPHYYWEFDRPTTNKCNVVYMSVMLTDVSIN